MNEDSQFEIVQLREAKEQPKGPVVSAIEPHPVHPKRPI